MAEIINFNERLQERIEREERNSRLDKYQMNRVRDYIWEADEYLEDDVNYYLGVQRTYDLLAGCKFKIVSNGIAHLYKAFHRREMEMVRKDIARQVRDLCCIGD